MNKRLSVSAFVSCYNEEQNIKVFLDSLLSQKEDIFMLEEIFIFNDGSTDNTLEEVGKIHDARVKVFSFKERIGKSSHLNTFFNAAKGDIRLVFDGDVVLDSVHTVENLVKPFLLMPRLGLIGGNAQALPGRNFLENAINVTFYAFDHARVRLRDGHNPLCCNGCILALSRDFAERVHVPENTIANDAFLYFSCITKGFEFRNARNAIAWYRSPSNLADHFRQNKRFIASKFRLRKTFGNLVDAEYAVPAFTMLQWQLIAFFRWPIHAIFIFIVNRIMGWQARKEEGQMDARWPMAFSTKEKIQKI